MNVNDILSKLPPEALASLTVEEKSFLAKETMNLDTLVTDDTPMEEANLVGLRIFSLLSGVPAEDEATMPSQLQALAHFEDKELVGLFKKLVKLDCYKMRKRKAAATNEEKAETNPLDSL